MKRTTVLLLTVALAAFLTSGCVDQSKIKELQGQIGQSGQAIHQKDIKIKALTEQALVKQKALDAIAKDLNGSKSELDSVKKELDGTKTELDNTKKELDSVNSKLKTLTAPPVTIKK